MKVRNRLGVLLCAAVFTASVPAVAMAGDTVYVNCDVLRCRSSAKIEDGNIVGNVYYGQGLERLGTEGEWTLIRVDGKKSYVASRYLTAQKPTVTVSETTVQDGQGTSIGLSANWKYAQFSKINSGKAVLYQSTSVNRKNKTVCVNAGHGTSGGSNVKTQCHPDGSPKVTGGTTASGATSAVAVSSGMTFADGTAEAKVTLALAKILKEQLLAEGYDVLMIRESDDVQLDNIARTVIANNKADCHIALHWDSTASDKGAFYMSVPSSQTYRSMEPVASHWQQHNQLGSALISGLKGAGVKIFSGGSMEMDLTQTSYSTIPSVDIELGDKTSDHSRETLSKLAGGLVAGVDEFFAGK